MKGSVHAMLMAIRDALVEAGVGPGKKTPVKTLMLKFISGDHDDFKAALELGVQQEILEYLPGGPAGMGAVSLTPKAFRAKEADVAPISSDSLRAKKEARFRYLHQLYAVTDGRENEFRDMWEVGDRLGFSRQQTEAVVQYLNAEHLTDHRGIGGVISITHRGVMEVESALSAPDEATNYFPPLNLIHIGTMIGSNLQQGTHGGHQSVSSNEFDACAVSGLVEAFRREIDSLPSDLRSHAEAELSTLHAQLNSPKPSTTILRESLRTLRSLTENVAASGIAAILAPYFEPLLRFINGA